MKLVGLSGGIASGKSTVASIISESFDHPTKPDSNPCSQHSSGSNTTVGIIDCDVLAREVVEPGRWGYRRVVAEFSDLGKFSEPHHCGSRTVIRSDGTLDRELLGSVIFSDATARKRLQRALHLPIFIELVRKIISFWWCGLYDIVLVDMPLLFETKFYLLTSPYNILVACSRDTQVERLSKRDKLSTEEALERIQSQMPTEKKAKLARYILYNDGNTFEDLRERTCAVMSQIISDQSSPQQLRLILISFIVVMLLVVTTIVFIIFILHL